LSTGLKLRSISVNIFRDSL